MAKKREARGEEAKAIPQPAAPTPMSGPKIPAILIQTALIFVLFALAIAMFLFTSYIPPKVEELENISQIFTSPNVTASAANVTECKNILFKAGKKDDYTYNIQITAPIQFTSVLRSYFVGEEEFEGQRYYIRATDTTISGVPEVGEGTSRAKAYFNANWSCQFQIVEVSMAGRNFTQRTPCGEDIFTACADEFEFIKNETIDVPAGRFDTQLWQSKDGKSKVWIGRIPAPIKVLAGNITMVLVEYKEG